ncbi:MAG: TolC family protein [Planctomycetota bacterium]|nr:TolC family protein [Planctomycetota bacterium]
MNTIRKLFPLLAVCLVSCSITGYEQTFKVSDSEVDDLVAKSKYAHHLGRTRKTEEPQAEQKLEGLTVDDCIGIALRNNRRYLNELENLFVRHIDVEVEKHNYFPLLDPLSMSYQSAWANNGIKNQTDTYSSSTGIRQKIPFGGSLAATSTLAHAEDEADPKTRGSTLTPSVTLTLPLIKGRGMIVGMNTLVSAARAHRYATREVENIKQAFLIDVLDKYFSIVSLQKEIKNYEINLENATKLKEKSQTQYDFGKVSKVDVFRAEYLETGAKKDLLIARENLKLSMDAFKIDLGIDPETDISLQEQEIAFAEVDVAEKDYMASALENNILWQNTKDQYDDAKRNLVIANDLTKIQADLTGSWQETRSADDPTESYDRDDEEWNAALTVNIPLDRKSIEAEYHKRVVEFVQFERNFDLSRDMLVRDARSHVIAVKQAKLEMDSAKIAVDQAEKAKELLDVQYEQGVVTNRDVIDAQLDVIRAKNGYLRSLVSHKVATLRLRQFEGTLVLDETGGWWR